MSQLELLVEQARSLTDSEEKSSIKKGFAGIKKVRSFNDLISLQQSGSSASGFSDCKLDLDSLNSQKRDEINDKINVLDFTSGN